MGQREYIAKAILLKDKLSKLLASEDPLITIVESEVCTKKNCDNSVDATFGFCSQLFLNSFLASGNLSLQTFGFEIRNDRISVQSGSKPFDTLIVFLKQFLKKGYFQKKLADDKSMEKITQHDAKTKFFKYGIFSS